MGIIPFSPFPTPVLERISRPFLRMGASLSNAFPYLKIELEQANLKIDTKVYCAMMIFLWLFYFLAFAIIFPLLLSKFTEMYLLLGITVAAIISFLIFIQLSMYPKMLVRKKVRDIEQNLMFSLRTILVHIKSGVSLFDAMNLIAKGNYGAVSQEFKKAVDEMNTGTMQQDALQKIATQNPSNYFRKALWQIVNGMKAGGDVNDILAESVSTMNTEQKIAIRKYGNQLRVLSLIYMMMGVIVPALGLTFLIILGSFPQIQITETMFWVLLIGVALMQFMYIGVIKSRRPNIISA